MRVTGRPPDRAACDCDSAITTRVLAQLVGRHRLAIALDVEGRGDDLTLLLRQRADLVLPPPPPPPPPPAFDCAWRNSLPSGRMLEEVDVARRRLRAGDRVVVGGPRVVRHEVARLRRSALRGRTCGPAVTSVSRLLAVEQPQRLLGAAVDRVDQLEILDAVVVFGARLDEHFFDRRRRRVAARLAKSTPSAADRRARRSCTAATRSRARRSARRARCGRSRPCRP